MHVILKLGPDGRVKDLDLEGTDTIAEVRLKVAAVTGVHPEHQRLVLREGDVELLDDTTTVAQHHIRKEAEIRLIARPAPRVISLNVGGSHHSTLLSTLRKVEGSRLDKMFDGLAPIEHVASAEGVPHEVSTVFIPRQADGAYFIDRDGRLFEYVIDYLRDCNSAQAQASPEPEPEGEPAEDVAPAEVSLPSSPDDLRQLAEHAGFYGLPGLTAACRQRLAEQERGPFFASTSARLFETVVPCGPRQGRNAENQEGVPEQADWAPHLVVCVDFIRNGTPAPNEVGKYCAFDNLADAHGQSVRSGCKYRARQLRNGDVLREGIVIMWISRGQGNTRSTAGNIHGRWSTGENERDWIGVAERDDWQVGDTLELGEEYVEDRRMVPRTLVHWFEQGCVHGPAFYHILTPLAKHCTMYRFDVSGVNFGFHEDPRLPPIPDAKGCKPLDLTFTGYTKSSYRMDFFQHDQHGNAEALSQYYHSTRKCVVLKFGPVDRHCNAFSVHYQGHFSNAMDGLGAYRVVCTADDVEL